MRTILAATIACLAADRAWANGGGYSTGGVSETGTVQGFVPSETEKVHIVDERLDVALAPWKARVQVRYILKNTDAKRADVRFGFPVEELEPNDPFADPATVKPRKAELLYCRDYHVELGGKALAAKFEAENPNDPDPRRKGIKGWLISKMSLAPGEEKTLLIGYLSDYPYSDSFISEDGWTAARIFKYRLSTGACWQGPIEHGSITVHPDGPDPREVKVLQPANRFHQEGGQWLWNFDNLKPTMADDITIQAAPSESYYGRRAGDGSFPKNVSDDKTFEFIERDGKWSVVHENYSVKASSTLPPQGDKSYAAENVKGQNGGTVWSEGAPGPGIGEWLELTPEVPKPLNSIRIISGYAASDNAFIANARPKRLTVQLNDEHKFDWNLEDVSRLQVIPVIGYDKPVRRIRLTIAEVYPGSRFEDCCISKIALETALNKKPHIKPSR